MKIPCPKCGQNYEVEERYQGEMLECIQCGQQFKAEILSEKNIVNTKISPLVFIRDLFHIKEIRKELNLKNRVIEEYGIQDAIQKEKQLEILAGRIAEKQQEFEKVQREINTASEHLNAMKKKLIVMNEELLLQDFGLYEPKYDFINSEQYKQRLNLIRQKQKEMIKNKTAVSGNMNWTVNGSLSQGKKMVSDMQKLLLRAFNGECEEITSKVTYANFETSQERITSSYEAISKLGRIMNVAVTYPYYQLKQQELNLAFEYRQKKQQEKEEQRAIKAQMREEAKLQKEIEEARWKIEKEQRHYINALKKVQEQIKKATGKEKADLQVKKQELESQLSDIDKSLKDIDYREANQKAGYVYIISNIGAFGENVYKIGMTRRLDPTERVDELGDASVPFAFDIHAMIFSDNAPALESALHRAFEKRKLNWVNQRREFFNVTLDEIKKVVAANYDKTAEFIETAAAEQYRITMKMKQKQGIL